MLLRLLFLKAFLVSWDVSSSLTSSRFQIPIMEEATSDADPLNDSFVLKRVYFRPFRSLYCFPHHFLPFVMNWMVVGIHDIKSRNHTCSRGVPSWRMCLSCLSPIVSKLISSKHFNDKIKIRNRQPGPLLGPSH